MITDILKPFLEKSPVEDIIIDAKDESNNNNTIIVIMVAFIILSTGAYFLFKKK